MPSEEDRLERLYRKALAAKKPVIKDGEEYVCPHGLKVFTVDGTQIRNNLDSDFIQGSGYNFRFIPKGEIWMDYVLPISELDFLILHECQQAEKLRQGKDPEDAYEHARKAEARARKAAGQ